MPNLSVNPFNNVNLLTGNILPTLEPLPSTLQNVVPFEQFIPRTLSPEELSNRTIFVPENNLPMKIWNQNRVMDGISDITLFDSIFSNLKDWEDRDLLINEDRNRLVRRVNVNIKEIKKTPKQNQIKFVYKNNLSPRRGCIILKFIKSINDVKKIAFHRLYGERPEAFDVMNFIKNQLSESNLTYSNWEILD